MTKTPTVMTEDERSGPVWRKVEDWANDRIVTYHRILESNADHDKTTSLRGQIRELRDLLKLGTTPNTPPPHFDTAIDAAHSLF